MLKKTEYFLMAVTVKCGVLVLVTFGVSLLGMMISMIANRFGYNPVVLDIFIFEYTLLAFVIMFTITAVSFGISMLLHAFNETPRGTLKKLIVWFFKDWQVK